MAVLMYAKYRGTCRACRGGIQQGDLIVFAGRGNAKHRDCCAANANYRWAKGARARTRDAEEGQTYKQRYGRCEDAPCCGCCGYQNDRAEYEYAQEAAWERGY